ncbi:MAG: hypothetical protein RR705_02015 [Lachnospiraceae bacterium]
MVKNSIIVHQTKSGDQLSFYFETDKALWQGYDEESVAVSPDWTEPINRPTISPKAYSACINSNVSNIGHGVWTYNSVVLVFDDTTGLTADGVFKINATTDALTIMKNLASSTNKNGDILSYSAKFDNGYAETSGGQIEVKLDIVGSNSYYGYVDLTSSTLKEGETDSIVATANLLLGTIPQSAFTLKWCKQSNQNVIGTGKTLNITRDMVDGRETFYCEYYVEGILKTTKYFSVYDVSDPVQIVFVLFSDVSSTSAGKNVVYKAYLQKNSGGQYVSATSMTGVFLNSRKNIIVHSTTPSTVVEKVESGIKYCEITVTYSDGEMIASDNIKNGAIEVVITGNY